MRAGFSLRELARYVDYEGPGDQLLSYGQFGRTWELSYRRFQPQPPFGASRAYVRTVAPK